MDLTWLERKNKENYKYLTSYIDLEKRTASCSLIADLRSEEVLEDSEVVDLELNDEGLLLMEAQPCKVRDGCCLVEHVQVAESELLAHWLLHLKESLILLLVPTVVVTKFDWTWADFSLDREDHEVSAGCHLYCLTEGEELLADLRVLIGVDSHDWLVLCLWDG